MNSHNTIALETNDVVNALSFDLEDWFHMIGIAGLEDPEAWEDLPSLFEKTTLEILDELDKFGVRATFFVLGWMALKYPRIVAEVARRGHEIGSHSHSHKMVGQLGPKCFADDLERSLDAIHQCTNQQVLGYRAPSFSIVPGCEWVFDALLDTGIQYDASLFPARRAHGGYACPGSAHVQQAPSGRSILELPMSTMTLAGKTVGFSGGGYLRLLPMAAIRAGFRQSHHKKRPVVVYLHPRDFVKEFPRAQMPLFRSFKTRVGLRTTWPKFRAMLSDYSFDTCAEILGIQSQLRPCSL